ncbi:MAG: hypothetical protein N2045_05000 [Fimbriimonadales bacterium]|nr:hypothetical protein [Fimbriimonadales bacterium]
MFRATRQCAGRGREPRQPESAPGEVVGSIEYTHAHSAQRTGQGSIAFYLQRNLGNPCAGVQRFQKG